jgi:hypothetical protein
MTGASGLVLRHLGLLSEDVLQGVSHVQARARIPGTAYAVSPVVPLQLGEMHVLVSLPALARVNLRWVDSEGATLRQQGDVYLQLTEAPARTRDLLWQYLAAGTASFPVVPGARYTARLGSNFPKECRWNIDAPAMAGAIETKVLRLEPALATVSWRTIDDRGRPVAQRRLVLVLQGHGARRSVLLETDAAGRAQVVMSPEWTDRAVERAVLRTFGDDGRRASLRAYGMWYSGAHDLGDVVFRRNLLVSGEVIREVTPTAKNTGITIQRRDAKNKWVYHSRYVSWTANRIHVYGLASLDALRVRASAIRGSRRPSPWVSFTAGSTGIVLRLAPGATVEVPVRGLPDERLPIWVRAVPLAGQAMEADESERRAWRAGCETERSVHPAQRSLWISRLPMGRYRIEVSCAVVPAAVFGVDVEVSAVDSAVRLPPVDLEDYLRPVRLQVVTSEGKPVSRGFARVRVAGSRGAGAARAIRDGVAILWLDRPREVEVRVPHHPPETLSDVFADTTVTLRPEQR